MCIHLKFDYKRATQALNYFAIKKGGNIDMLTSLKLIYFADRYHLRKYGRPITNDEYFAMEHGPVASGTKDIATMNSDYLGDDVFLYSSSYLSYDGNTYSITSRKPLDEDVFSDSDLEALSFAFDKFAKYSKWDLRDITHIYPEWRKLEQVVRESNRALMNIEDFLEDPVSVGAEKCYELNDKQKTALREMLKERIKVENLWS